MQKIKGTELTWEASRNGFGLYYRNQPIGGAACKGRGSPINQKFYISEAKTAVKNILNGVGEKRFLDEIDRIQKEDA